MPSSASGIDSWSLDTPREGPAACRTANTHGKGVDVLAIARGPNARALFVLRLAVVTITISASVSDVGAAAAARRSERARASAATDVVRDQRVRKKTVSKRKRQTAATLEPQWEP